MKYRARKMLSATGNTRQALDGFSPTDHGPNCPQPKQHAAASVKCGGLALDARQVFTETSIRLKSEQND